MGKCFPAIILACSLLSGCFGASQPESPVSFDAKIELTIKKSAATKAGLQVGDFAKAYEDFVAKSKSFNLSDIQSIKVTDGHGTVFELREFAEVEVRFTKREK